MIKLPRALPCEAVRRVCAPADFEFATTADLPGLEQVLGQPRAVAALEFGAGIASHGFNLFALGLPGSGKTTLIREYLERRAAGQPTPADLCYVYNFRDARRPHAVRLPAGQAAHFRKDIADLMAELKQAIPKAFEGKEYDNQRDKLMNELNVKVSEELTRLEEGVKKWGFQLIQTSTGLLLIPAIEGKPISEQELEALNPEQRGKLLKTREQLGQEIEEGVRRKRELEKGTRDALHALDIETATYAVQQPVNGIRAKYAGEEEGLA